MDDLDRRDLLRIVAAGAVAATAKAQDGTPSTMDQQAPYAPKFFSPDEFAMVDALTDIVIPTDEQSPGAKAAHCAAYIDFRLSETTDQTAQQGWHDGLKLVDALSQKLNGAAFLQATPEQRTAVVTAMAKNEHDPQSLEEKFFLDLKHRTVEAYYTSSIGIHKDQEYKGNIYLAEFVGWDANDGRWHMQIHKP